MFNGGQALHTPMGAKRTRDSSDEEDAENFQPASKRSGLEVETPPVGHPLAQSTPQVGGWPHVPYNLQQPFTALQNHHLSFGFHNPADYSPQAPTHVYNQQWASPLDYSQPPFPTSFAPLHSSSSSTFDSGHSSRLVDSSFFSTGSSNLTSGSTSSFDPLAVFCEPSGRLGLLNKNQKHAVTAGEVLRRLSAPERVNISLLGGYLRRAKGTGANEELLQELRASGIPVPDKRRKVDFRPTTFTALLEAEADLLVNDFDDLLSAYFPAKELLDEVARLIVQRRSEWAHTFVQALHGRNGGKADEEVVFDLLVAAFGAVAEVLERDRSLVDMKVEAAELHANQPFLPAKLQHGLEQFNLITHNFGVRAVRSVFAAMVSCSADGRSSSRGFDHNDEVLA